MKKIPTKKCSTFPEFFPFKLKKGKNIPELRYFQEVLYKKTAQSLRVHA